MQEDKNAKKADANDGGFVQRLMATIIKNLEVTITKVHIRFEDKQLNSNRFPFATGKFLFIGPAVFRYFKVHQMNTQGAFQSNRS